ncbi:DUF418 domain-containing protein [Paenibacillus dokdonensis]|uniref:DUF418 domain-containing protein n=1 Tax=Paenibacillus dokdonensis TaxID=2567944 RepID=A0ABU6GV51_9BACL|nr:DUF418 domain-containing protein [Paenibacillus dokdonensis]MEC0243602.1 DUF418 domain-containing protein [Paenibacillus dokdonensis]
MRETTLLIPQQNRIVELDMLRGFALLGIFLVNIFNFFQTAGVSSELLPNFEWVDILLTGKFYAIFSLLFGVGSAIFLRRAKEKGKPYRYYIRRMIGLALIGLLHAMILGGGDVLVSYALVGMVLLALHKIPANKLFIITFTLHVLGIMVNILSYDWLYGGKPDMPLILDVSLTVTALTSFLIYFVEGFTLMNMEVLEKLMERPALHKRLVIVLGTLSVGTIIAQFLVTAHKPGHILLIVSQPIIMVFYILLLLAFAKTSIGNTLLKPLQSYGKMAMSNYLGQTAVGIFILPLFVNHYQPGILLFGVCIFTWVLQIVISNVWLSRFAYGPVEWIWRCFTYGRLFSMRK